MNRGHYTKLSRIWYTKMITSIHDIISSGDAIDFVIDNHEHLEVIEECIAIIEGEIAEPYRCVADFLEDFIKEYLNDEIA